VGGVDWIVVTVDREKRWALLKRAVSFLVTCRDNSRLAE
jgi:hypothetical protein